MRSIWRRWSGVAVIALIGLAGAAIVAATAPLLREPPQTWQVNLQPPFGTRLSSGVVLSPDGTMAAFTADDGDSRSRRLWITRLDTGESRALPGTEGASLPFWSPDSNTLGFFSGGFMRKLTLPNGPVQQIVRVGIVPEGVSWDEDTIIFAAFRAHLNAVSAAGGDIRPVTTVDVGAGDRAHEWPSFIPGTDGRFLFTVQSTNPDRAGTYLGYLDGRPARRLLSDQHGTHAPPGYVLFVRERTLLVQRFNPVSERLEGIPVPIAGNVTRPTLRNDALISAGQRVLAFGGGIAGGRLLWLDRTGQQVGTTNASDLHSPMLVGDRNQVLVEGNGIWLIDLDRETRTRVVGDGSTPVASPDGTRMVFNAARERGINDLYVTAIGSNQDELLLATDENKLPNHWTRDGRYLVYASRNPRTGRDLWVLPLFGDRTPVPFSTENGNQIQAQVSPDGRWIAYASSESGSWQVYVQAFPGGGSKQSVSPDGGAKPQWRADGRELFYLTPDRTLMSAPVSASGAIGSPRPLFQAPVIADLGVYLSQFVPSADGQRFLFDAADPSSAREPVSLLINWTEGLED